MIPQSPVTAAVGAVPGSRAITEVGPYIGSTSLTVGTGLVFVSADGTWGHRPG